MYKINLLLLFVSVRSFGSPQPIHTLTEIKIWPEGAEHQMETVFDVQYTDYHSSLPKTCGRRLKESVYIPKPSGAEEICTFFNLEPKQDLQSKSGEDTVVNSQLVLKNYLQAIHGTTIEGWTFKGDNILGFHDKLEMAFRHEIISPKGDSYVAIGHTYRISKEFYDYLVKNVD